MYDDKIMLLICKFYDTCWEEWAGLLAVMSSSRYMANPILFTRLLLLRTYMMMRKRCNI